MQAATLSVPVVAGAAKPSHSDAVKHLRRALRGRAQRLEAPPRQGAGPHRQEHDKGAANVAGQGLLAGISHTFRRPERKVQADAGVNIAACRS